MRLDELGEDKLLAKILPHLQPNSRIITGAGDDCAVVRFRSTKDLLLLKTDCVVENIHFGPDTDGRAVGWDPRQGVSDGLTLGPETFGPKVAAYAP